MKRIQAKKHKIETYEINKISLSCLMIKDKYQMMEFILQLIIIKIASQVVKKFKKIVPIKKNKTKIIMLVIR